MSSGLKSMARMGCAQAQLASRLRPQAAGSRTFRPHTAVAGRVHNHPSRALEQFRTFSSRHASQRFFSNQAPRTSSLGGVHTQTILKSGFPKKTAVFLLLLGGFVYYFIEVQELTWADVVLNSYEEATQQRKLHASPLHFFDNKDELEHWIGFHIPNPSVALKDPNVARFFSEQFDKLAFGWMMSEEEAKKENLPVTHGLVLGGAVPWFLEICIAIDRF